MTSSGNLNLPDFLRSKLILVISYIYPPSFRIKMAKLWDMPDVSYWWLPGMEDYPLLVQNIRAFLGDHTIQSDRQAKSEDVRNMKALLSNLSVVEKKS